MILVCANKEHFYLIQESLFLGQLSWPLDQRDAELILGLLLTTLCHDYGNDVAILLPFTLFLNRRC